MSVNSIKSTNSESFLNLNFVTTSKFIPGEKALIATVRGTLQHLETGAQIAVKEKVKISFNEKPTYVKTSHPAIIHTIACIFTQHLNTDPELKDPRFHPDSPLTDDEKNPSKNEIFTKKNIAADRIERMNSRESGM